MTRLPSALEPWAAQLQALPTDLALSLHPWLARLWTALGPLHIESVADGEPNGYGGLLRRGPLQRLVSTEWLLLWELPDEFIRRAINSEQMFFELARSSPAASRRIVALFDTGPWQLGAPRLAHLAALIVLARRAAEHRADLYWGSLCAEEPKLLQGCDERAIRALLGARSVDAPDEQRAAAWAAAVGEVGKSDELWLLGGASIESLRPLIGWSRVIVNEDASNDEGKHGLVVDVCSARRPAQRIELTLPEPDVCVRLLRAPFGTSTGTGEPIHLDFELERTLPIAFSPDGRRIGAWLRDGGFVSFSVPQSPRARSGKPKLFRPEPREVVLAHGSRGKRLLFLTASGSGEFFYGASASNDYSRSGHKRMRISTYPVGELPTAQELLSWRPGHAFETLDGAVYVIRRDGAVFRLDTATKSLLGQGRALAAVVAPNGGVLFVRFAVREVDGVPEPHALLEYQGPGAHARSRWIPLEPSLSGVEVHVGHLSSLARCIGLRTRPDAITVMNWPASRRATIMSPGSSRLIGVQGLGGQPGLVLLEPEGLNLIISTRSEARVLGKLSSGVAQSCVSQGSPHIAVLTDTGELVVFSSEHDQPVLRVVSRGAT